MQAQAGQAVEQLAAPLHALGHKTLGGRQHGIGVCLAAHAPEQAFGLQPRARAGGAGGVAAVFGQQHADVHLVRLALQILEEAADAVPLLVPVAFAEVGRAPDHPFALLGRELVPRRVARNARAFGMAHQVVLALLPRRGLNGLDGAGAQGEAIVRNHQPPVHPDHAAKAAAVLARAHGGVEGKQRRYRLRIAAAAFGAVQAGGKRPPLRLAPRAFIGQGIGRELPAAALEGDFNRLHHAGALGAGHAHAVGHHFKKLLPALHALGLHAREAAGRQPLPHFVFRGVGGQRHGKGDDDARVVQAPHARGSACFAAPRRCARGCLRQVAGAAQQLVVNAVGRVVPHGQRGLRVKQLARAGEQELDMVVQLRHRAHGGAAGAHGVGLVDGDGRRHALHLVHGGLVHAVEKLPRIGAEGFHVAALALGIQRVEHQAGFARSAGAGHHRHLAGTDIHIQILQVVLARAANTDQVIGGRGRLRSLGRSRRGWGGALFGHGRCLAKKKTVLEKPGSRSGQQAARLRVSASATS